MKFLARVACGCEGSKHSNDAEKSSVCAGATVEVRTCVDGGDGWAPRQRTRGHTNRLARTCGGLPRIDAARLTKLHSPAKFSIMSSASSSTNTYTLKVAGWRRDRQWVNTLDP